MWQAIQQSFKALFPTTRNTRLQADRQAVVLGGQNAGVINTGTIQGDVILDNGEPTQSLQIPFKDLNTAELSPMQCLHWSSRLPTQLVGRDTEFAQLRDWANSTPTLSIAALAGGAGLGKTRLAFELAIKLKEEAAWQAGKISDPSRPIGFTKTTRGVLLIIDYPDETPQALTQFLKQLAAYQDDTLQQAAGKLRVLLLCRDYSVIANRHDLLSRAGAAGLLPLTLQALPEAEPWALFNSTYGAFSQLPRGKNAPSPVALPSELAFDNWLRQNSQHRHPLYLQALAYHYARPTSITPSLQVGDALIEGLLQREKKHFLDRCEALSWPPARQTAAWALQVIAAVAGKLSFDELQTLATQHPKPAGHELPTLAQWRELCGAKASGLAALEPDLFAAHALHNAALLPDAEHWAAALLPTLLGVDAATTTLPKNFSLEDRLYRLARLEHDKPAATRSKVSPWLTQLCALGEQQYANPAWLVVINEVTLPQALHRLAIALYTQRISSLKNTAPSSESLAETAQNKIAAHYHNLAVHLSALGRHEEALKAIQEAINIIQPLAQTKPAAYAPDLAMSLNNLSGELAALGQHDEALKAIQEAINIRRPFAQANPSAYAPDLAMSLNNLSNRLAALGQHDEALKAIQEAINIRRPLAQANPAAYAPNLASSLNNLSNQLAALGRHEEALSASQEAVALYEPFFQANPAAYGRNFSIALRVHAKNLNATGRTVEAEAILQQLEAP